MFRLSLICLLLAGCVTGPSTGAGLLRGSGEETPAPAGYQRLCSEYPDFEACTK